MESDREESLKPELEEAQHRLGEALDEACSTDIKDANTGELIRIEEVLAIANEAAKKAVSIRRRLGRDRRGVGEAPPRTTGEAARPGGEVAETHRSFEDERGVRWDAFAVYPTAEVAERARLPEPFRSGWLSFDSGTEKRRLSPIPEGWQGMSEERLRALCTSAGGPTRRTEPPGSQPGPH